MTSIRVIDYNGDFDTLNEIFLIGPYPTDAAAEADCARLDKVIPYGCYETEITNLSSDDMADPILFADVSSEEEFEAAFGKAFH